MAEALLQHTLSNGLTLLAEPMPHVRSAAFNLLLPAGGVYDPEDKSGLSHLTAGLISRGAGNRSSRDLMLALDSLGLDRDEASGTYHMRCWGSTLAKNLEPALEIFADIIRRPHLPEEELEPVRALTLQELQGIEDEPRQKLMIELRKRHFPPPLGRELRGTPETLANCSIADVRRFVAQGFQARGAILSVAGDINWNNLKGIVERCFGGLEAKEPLQFTCGERPNRRDHLRKDTNQTQIGLAYDSVPVTHPDYYAAIGAVNVLSGGMSARLFTEVREKRGLCYSVWASYQTLKDRACVLCYAGSTNERAGQTLEVLHEVLGSLAAGVTEDEVERVKAGLKSSLIMQEESTSARAGSMAGDWFLLGRVRTFDEISAGINSLTPSRIMEYARQHPPEDVTLVTLGPTPLA